MLRQLFFRKACINGKGNAFCFAFVRHESSLAALTEDREVEYPPVKPKYPADGTNYDGVNRRVAWYMHDIGEEMKTKLEKMAGSEPHVLYRLTKSNPHPDPGLLQLQKYVTKTHIVESGLPSAYLNANVDKEFKELWPVYKDCIEDIFNQFEYVTEEKTVSPLRTTVEYNDLAGDALLSAQTNRFFQSLLHHITSPLGKDHPHLRRAMHSHDAPLRTWWLRHGYEDKEEIPVEGKLMVPPEINIWRNHKYIYDDIDSDCIYYDVVMDTTVQIRSEKPLPPVVAMDDALVTDVEMDAYQYSPEYHLAKKVEEKNISYSGYKVGDACEYHFLTGIAMSDNYRKHVANHPDLTKQHENSFLSEGLMTAFAATTSQALNLGFNQHSELTYPLVLQQVVCDGRFVQFMLYQLNTTQLWKPPSAKTNVNLLWHGPRIPIYGAVKNGKVEDVNADVLRQLLKFLVNKPVDHSDSILRPNLPDDPRPCDVINRLGTEAPPRPATARHPWEWKFAEYF